MLALSSPELEQPYITADRTTITAIMYSVVGTLSMNGIDVPRPADNPWVIAGREPGARLTHLAYYWYPVRERAGLNDVRLHDLRHSFASRALALGEDLTMIGKLLGHRKIQTTARYAHLARDSVKESAALVAASIGADILP